MESDANMEISNDETKQDICPVCLEAPVSETTKCQHKFCSPCLNAWLAEKSSCPLCRSELVNAGASARTNDNNFIYTVPWAIVPEDPIYRPLSNFSRIDTTELNLRFRRYSEFISQPAEPDGSFIYEPIEPVVSPEQNNMSVTVPPYPEEFRGMPYTQVHIPSLYNTNVSHSEM